MSSVISPCAAKLSPQIVTASLLLDSDANLCDDVFANPVQQCPDNPDEISEVMLDKIKRQVDDKLLCELMCCCTKSPNIGAKAKTNQKQGCVASTVDLAGQALNNKNRYKSEMSYNMDVFPPTPFMHRDGLKQHTLEKSEYWQGRARDEIPGYKPKAGLVRRPDIIIVKDAAKPPYQDNIDRVIEMKFKGDKLAEGQAKAYEVIAGGDDKLTIVQEGKDCHCAENEGEKIDISIPIPAVTEADEPSIDWDAAIETIGWSTVTAIGVAATVAAALIPVDGPVGEVAAGSATAAAATRTTLAFRRIFANPKNLIPDPAF